MVQPTDIPYVLRRRDTGMYFTVSRCVDLWDPSLANARRWRTRLDAAAQLAKVLPIDCTVWDLRTDSEPIERRSYDSKYGFAEMKVGSSMKWPTSELQRLRGAAGNYVRRHPDYAFKVTRPSKKYCQVTRMPVGELPEWLRLKDRTPKPLVTPDPTDPFDI